MDMNKTNKLEKRGSRMKKYLVLILVVALFVIPMSACVNNADDELVVGMELKYPPFETTDANNNPDGISVKFAYALGEYLGRPVRIEGMDWNGLIPSLTTNKIDLIISSMTIRPDRQEVVNFSNPYAKAQLSLLVYKDSPVWQFNDLKADGRKLAVKKGTTGHTFAIDNLPEKNIVVFNEASECILEVSQGRADAFIYDALSIFNGNKLHPDTTRTLFEPFQEDYEYWGVAINKEDTQLLEDVNKFIKKYQDEGGMDKLADEYLGEIKKVFDDLDLPFFFDID
jgi:polar amino acid transport system substrate-binding protein